MYTSFAHGDLQVETSVVLTTTPNELMASIHDRMPVILEPNSHHLWLAQETAVGDLVSMVRPYGADQMTAWPVDPKVGRASYTGADCIEAVKESALKPAQLELF